MHFHENAREAQLLTSKAERVFHIAVKGSKEQCIFPYKFPAQDQRALKEIALAPTLKVRVPLRKIQITKESDANVRLNHKPVRKGDRLCLPYSGLPRPIFHRRIVMILGKRAAQIGRAHFNMSQQQQGK
jgi:hypothetical protein